MNILVDILHPAHVHFFKEYILLERKKGNNVVITTRDKDITHHLLDTLGFDYQCLSRASNGTIGVLLETLIRVVKLIAIFKKERIDVAISISGFFTSIAGFVTRTKNICFTDTEDATLTNRVAGKLSDMFVTPEFFLHDFGSKHVRYKGLHELSYLQSFIAKESLELDLPERFVFLRLVSHTAQHDKRMAGFSIDNLRKMLPLLKKHGEVLVSSEIPLPEDIDLVHSQFGANVIHDVLARAEVFVGDSPTMAVEAALLGVPSFLLSTRWPRLGNMRRLESDWQLLCNFSTFDSFYERLSSIEDISMERMGWEKRVKKFKEHSDSVTDVIVRTVTLVVQGNEE